MAGATLYAVSQAERDELEAILKSRLLLRSPSVLRIAEYIVRKYLEGEAGSLKEYNIAVEALGKPADFDPKRDSIVRVEAHRLRKKLDEFYRTDAADHSFRVVVDPGQYSLRFEAMPPPPLITELARPVEPVEAPRPRFSIRKLLPVPLVFAALGLGVWSFLPAHKTPPPDSLWIVCGAPRGLMSPAASGVVWHGDKWFQGGKAVFTGMPLSTIPEVPHAGQRQGNFNYDIPLANAPYELRLYFGPPPVPGKPGAGIARGFDVSANGVKLLSALDPDVAEPGESRPVIRVFHDIRPARDGRLHLSFRSGREIGYVNAIEITPGIAGRLMPVRIVAKSAPYTEPGGQTWSADNYVASGGLLKIRSKPVSGMRDQNLMAGERYGNFTYDIPVSKGVYTLKLHLSESWFGPALSGGGVGSRRFDVYANRRALLQDFDIFREAGASDRAILKVFHGLAPNADGYIHLAFIPRVNNACINALELDDESR